MATQHNDARLTAVRTLSGMTTGDTNTAWRAYLLTTTGLTSGTINDLEYAWLGGLGYTGSLNDRWRAYLLAEGYTGSTSDMMNALWAAGGPATGGSFTVDAAQFDGINDWLERAGLSGAVDGKKFTLSMWVDFDALETDNLIDLSSGSERFYLRLGSTGDLRLQGSNAAGTTLLVATASIGTVTTGGGWYHIGISVDMANSANRHFMLNGVSVGPSWSTYIDDTIDFTTTVATVGAHEFGVRALNAGMAEVFLHLDYMDLSVSSNLEKFRSTDGKPVDLGTDGSTPFGAQPILYLHLDDGETANNFALNAGSGGDFTVNGALTTDSSSPSD